MGGLTLVLPYFFYLKGGDKVSQKRLLDYVVGFKTDTSGFKSGMAKIEKSAQGLVGKLKGLLSPKVLGVAAVGALGVATAAVGKKALDMAENFQKGMANVATLVDTTKVDMDKLGDGILNMTTKVNKSAEDLTAGLYQTISAGIDAGDALEFLEVSAKAATAGLSNTETAVDALSTVINAYGMDASKAGSIADQMFKAVEQGKTTFDELASSVGKVIPTTASLNISTEELFASIATLTKGGLATSEAVTALKAALSNVIKPSSEAQKVAEELGIQFDANAIKTKGLSGFLQELKEKTGGNTEVMAKLFGSVEGLNAMLALTGKQSEEFSKVLSEMENASGSVENAFKKQTKTIAGMKESIRLSIDKIVTKLGMALLPALDSMLQWFVKYMPIVEETFETAWSYISQAIEWFKTNIMPTLIEVLNNFKVVWDTVFPYIKIVTETVFENIKTIIKTTITVITSVLSALSKFITGDFSGAWEDMKKAIRSILDGIVETLKNWGNMVLDLLVNPFKKAWDSIKKIVDKIKNAFSFSKKKSSSDINISYPSIPKFHSGGWVGNLRYDEVPAILQKGEYVLSREQIKGLALAGAGGLVINIQNMNVRNDNDIRLIARELFNLQRNYNRSKGGW